MPTRLAAGTTVHRIDSGWLVHTPREELVRIDCDDETASLIGNFFTDPERAIRDDTENRLEPLIGYLDQENALSRGPIPSVDCILRIDDDLDADTVRTLSRCAGLNERPVAAHPVVVVCSWLDDTLLCRIDDEMREAQRSWLPIYREGDTWYAGPLWFPEATPAVAGYRDLRIRRLAASACPDELLLLWGSGARPAATDHRLGRLATAFVWAAEALAHGTANRQYGIRSGGRSATHPVLPVPLHLARV